MTRRRTGLLLRICTAAARRPLVTLPATALCVCFGVWGAARIHPTGSLESMLSRTDPSAHALSRMVRDFGVTDELIVLATDRSNDPPRAKHERLVSFAARLAEQCATAPGFTELCVDAVYRDLPELRQFVEREMVPAAPFYLGREQFARLREKLSTAAIVGQIQENETLIAAGGPAAHALSQTVLQDPLRLHQLLARTFGETLPAGFQSDTDLTLSDDGNTLMIRLRGARPVADLEFAKRFVAHTEMLIRELNIEGLFIAHTGAYPIAVTAERAIRADMIRSITGSLILIGLLFLAVYRNPLSFPIAVTPVAVGILTAFGTSSLYSTELTPVVAVIGAVLAGLAVDYAIHFLSHVGQAQSADTAPADAVENTICDIGPAMLAACLTSVVGFLSIASSSVRALRQFALIGALGLALALVASLTTMPALLKALHRTGRSLGRRRGHGRLLLRRLTLLRARRGAIGAITGGIGAVLALVVLSAPNAGFHFENDLTVMHPRPNPPLEAQQRLAERFGRHPEPLLLLITAGSTENLVSTAYEVRARLYAACDHAGLAGFVGLDTLLPDPRTVAERRKDIQAIDAARIVTDFERAIEASIFDPAAYRTYVAFLRRFLTNDAAPDSHVLLQYPRLAAYLLPREFAGPDPRVTQALTLLFPDIGLDDRPARTRLIQTIRGALADLNGVTLTGVSVVAHDTEALIRRELFRLFRIAAIVVVAGIALYFRKITDALLALLPAAFALACVLGVMRLADQPFNMVNLVGLPLLVGLAVDNGIFLVSAARLARREPDQDMLRRYAAGVQAIAMTTLTTLLSFGSLLFTSTPAIASLGAMMTVGMGAAFAGAVCLLLPILLRRPTCPALARPHGAT